MLTIRMYITYENSVTNYCAMKLLFTARMVLGSKIRFKLTYSKHYNNYIVIELEF